ncbi:MAG: hypothetical protein E4G90_03395 [Gemmatimonadales bacterium]|nr:MAG: hypothetical protein E4G90_03395 [Gemmatimonadales bacterium]
MRLLLSGASLWLFLLTLGTPTISQAQSAPKWYERLTTSGDFRVRSESFFQETATARTRLRVRMRIGLTAKLTDGFTFGARIATGTPGNVTSTNVSLGSLNEMSLRVDRAYLRWSPNNTVEVSAGKLGLPVWKAAAGINSELVFDDDFAPDGLHQSLTLFRSSEGLVRRVTVLGDQWIMQEVSSGSDSWMVGTQGVLGLALDDRTTLDFSGAYFDFVNGDVLAQARNGNGELLISNAVITESGATVDGGVSIKPSSADPFARSANDFRLIQGTIGLMRSDVMGTRLAAYATVVHNTGADDDNSGIWAGASLGTASRPGQWALAMAWARVEQEAVLSMLSYSDLGKGGTNVQGPMLAVSWRPAASVTLSAKDHIMSHIRKVPGANANTLHRIQVDARVSF